MTGYTDHPVYQQLRHNADEVGNCLCIGLDPDIQKLPSQYAQTVDGVYQFLDSLIQQTTPYCIAYKPNISFFEALGIEGLQLLERIVKRIPQHQPIILDAKRGDIGNTSRMQAKFLFDYFGASASTLHPYMGSDSLSPFFEYTTKLHFVLAATSNPGAKDFQQLRLENGESLYSEVIKRSLIWHSEFQNIGLVVGATQPHISEIRKAANDLLFLMPGVGTQGAQYSDSILNGQNTDGLALINVSRQILYSDNPIHAIQNLLLTPLDN